MSEAIESTATVQSNEELDSDFDDFEAFSDCFAEIDPTDRQQIIDDLLSFSEVIYNSRESSAPSVRVSSISNR